MAKKVKLGTIKVTSRVTVRQQVRTHHTYQQNYDATVVPAVNTAEIKNAANKLHNETQKLEAAVKKTARPSTLPAGVYSPEVESLYSELDKRRKTEQQENDAMYDVFISHASEDKKNFVNPLVEALQEAGIRVWYDTLEMQWGKSLREQIDNGIKRSKFAILVLSKNFFAKKWPQRELDGILAKQDITGATPLPIWYDVSFEDVYEFSPTLSGVFSMSTASNSIEDICKALKLQLEKEEIQGL